MRIWGVTLSCYYTSSEGHFERCVDAECHKSKEVCMSRAGTMTFDGRRYGTMVWRPQPDVQDVSHKPIW